MTRRDELAHLRRIATPSRIGLDLGEKVIGRPYILHPWLLYLEEQVLEMLRRPGREIMVISVPPQEGKTTWCGLWLPFWYLGLNPKHQVLFISYNDEYAGMWGLRVRSLVEQFGPDLFGVGLSRNMGSAGNWKTTGDFGGMLSTGILGGITGNPGDLIIIDDVVKTMEDANSVTTLRKHVDEWDGSIQTRFQDNTKVLVVHTRWAENDLGGVIVKRSKDPEYGGDPVTHINIKAVAEPDDIERMSDAELEEWRDVLGRRFGESLKGQHSEGYFRAKQRTPGYEFTFSALFQGTPTARKGGMFPSTNWRYYQTDTPLPDFVQRRRVWDLGATAGGGDWTVGVLVGKTAENDFYVLDLRRFRADANTVMTEVKAAAAVDGFMVPIRIEEERAGAGKSLVELYKIELLGYDVDGVRAEADKTQRAGPYSRFQQAGKFHLPVEADWLEEFITEHRQMMGDGRMPRHDDQIDTVAYAVLEMFGYGEIEISDPAGETDPDVVESVQDLIDNLELDRSGDYRGPEGFRVHLASMANA